MLNNFIFVSFMLSEHLMNFLYRNLTVNSTICGSKELFKRAFVLAMHCILEAVFA